MSDLSEIIQCIIWRLRTPSQEISTLGDFYDVQRDDRPNGIVFFVDPFGPGIRVTITESGDNFCLRFDDDGTECLAPRDEFLGKLN
jgi:hypothetical protein